ncbi:MFS transporter [Rhizorhabdus histidinilytica]|jgi:AAHS family 4-hydroxybenzoate transporter-like MFS transporter|uniref:MFS transporter n=1 Tax=Rhizorhabdus histidinilytica TaxID=439228 RepID=UPI0016811C6C|nr:MFS transporter [Rhizorhabdus histidinilytica]
MSISSEGGAALPAVDFARTVREGPFGRRQGIIIFMLGLLVLLDGMDTQMLGVIAHDITRDLGLPISSFGVVFASGLAGAIIGAMVMSPMGDRWLGRKTITILSMALASLSTIVTPLATNLNELLLIRIIAGIGLGAAMPGVFSLLMEFSPTRYTRPITSCLVAFMPLGSFLGGMIGQAVVPDFGWRMLLYVGGGLTLAVTLVAMVLLPESVYFLLNIKKDTARALSVARRFLPHMAIGSLVPDERHVAARQNQPVAKLFAGGFWKFTLLIWLAYILNQGIVYFVLSWTPALLESSGAAQSSGMHAASMFGLGGALGTALQGWMAARFNIYRLMFIEMAVYVIGILILPSILADELFAPVAVFFISAGICAYHAGFIIILSETYPDDFRTTGFGWALGIGRFGATLAPVLAGTMVGLGWGAQHIFSAAAIPGVASALTLFGIAILLGAKGRRTRTAAAVMPAGDPLTSTR